MNLSLTSVLLTLLATVFAIVNGVNDGGALVTSSLRVSSIRPIVAVVTPVVALVVIPLVFGTKVATTLASRLVDFEGAQGEISFAAAVVGAIVVVAGLTRLGMPTSLTLALIGGIGGAGVASGFPMSWDIVIFVLAMGILAPVFGASGAYLLSRIPGRVPSGTTLNRWLLPLHAIAFGALCIAYGANDGQKMLAVFSILSGLGGGGSTASHLLIVGACFFAGTLIGLRRVSGTLARGIAPIRPTAAVAAEFSSAAAVLGSAAVGAPVSMTQALTGGLVGSSVSQGFRSVRWKTVFRVGTAWVVTLPLSAVVAAMTVSLIRPLTASGS